MISEDNHRVGVPFEKVLPCFKSADDSEEFAVINLIILFGWVQGLREVTARVVRPITVGLEEQTLQSLLLQNLLIGCVHWPAKPGIQDTGRSMQALYRPVYASAV